jgi:hypothetical protein
MVLASLQKVHQMSESNEIIGDFLGDNKGHLMVKPGTFDPVEHRRAKQAAREKDADDLAAGRVTAEELTMRNSLFASFPPGSITIKEYPEARLGKKTHGKRRDLSNPPEND